MIKPKAKIDPERRALKPCPFCGGKPYPLAMEDKVKLNLVNAEEYWYMCEDCHCSGPLGLSKRSAKVLWNERD